MQFAKKGETNIFTIRSGGAAYEHRNRKPR